MQGFSWNDAGGSNGPVWDGIARANHQRRKALFWILQIIARAVVKGGCHPMQKTSDIDKRTFNWEKLLWGSDSESQRPAVGREKPRWVDAKSWLSTLKSLGKPV